MAPEVINRQIYTEKADIYSYSLVMYELITRLEPYKGVKQMDLPIFVAVEKRRPDIPSACPPEFAKLIQKCWNPIADERPSFTEVSF
jgi:serine/threonine protein kinase